MAASSAQQNMWGDAKEKSRENKHVECDASFESDDEWFYDSVSKYDELHMFELQNASTTLEWVDEKALCVTCQQQNGKTEILKLMLPGKLQSDVAEKDLCRDRDFRVEEGGFDNKPISAVKCMKSTKMLVTAGYDDNDIAIWNVGKDDTSLIEKQCVINNKRPECFPACVAIMEDSSTSTKVAFGSTLQSICLTDLSTTRLLLDHCDSDKGDRLCGLHALDTHTLVACGKKKCKAWCMDNRMTMTKSSISFSLEKSTASSCAPEVWNCIVKQYPVSSLCYELWMTNDHGKIICWDSRKSDHSFIEARSTRHGHNCIQISPSGNDVSLSGGDGNVYVYDTKCIKSLELPATCMLERPSFIHKGHQACADSENVKVLTHRWHSNLPDCILSSATDGSLHAWQYKK